MASSSAYAPPSPQIESQFGHHDASFATLPSYKEFHQTLDRVGGLENLINLDIHEFISALALEKDSLFVIKVPTLGFTDPAHDYDIRPMFATPFSLNGYGAKPDAPIASRPYKVIAVDFMGNEYPLIFNDKGLIDYDAIAQTQGGKLYTTLKELHYVYTADQVLGGEGLTQLPMAPYHQGHLLLRAPEFITKAFDIEISVIRGDKTFLENKAHINFDDMDLYHLNQFSLHVEPLPEGSKIDIHIDANAFKVALPQQLGMSIQIPGLVMQDGIAHVKQDAQLSESVQLTHYLGLSPAIFDQVYEALIPKEKLSQSFSQTTNNVFNDFSNSEVLDKFYEVVKEGVQDNAIPIMALSDYFSSSEVLQRNLNELNLDKMTRADHEVYSQLLQSLNHPGDMAYDLADNLDQMLSIDKYFPQTHFSLISQDAIDPNMLEVMFELDPLDSNLHQAQQYKATHEGLTHLSLEADTFNLFDINHSDPYFSEQSLAQVEESLGNRYEISAKTLIDGAQVIDNFNVENHDVLDLNILFESLPGVITEPQVQLEQKGADMEVWVQETSPDGFGEKYHVATLTGVNGEDGNLPNLDQFIEFPG